MHRGWFDRAIPILESCLQGLHEKDKFILEGLCCAYFFKGDFENAKINLLELKKLRGDDTNNEFELLLARTYEELGEKETALAEFSRLVKSFSGPEASCRYALFLKKVGKKEESKTIFKRILKDARLSPKFYQKAQRQWIDIAKSEI